MVINALKDATQALQDVLNETSSSVIMAERGGSGAFHSHAPLDAHDTDPNERLVMTDESINVGWFYCPTSP